MTESNIVYSTELSGSTNLHEELLKEKRKEAKQVVDDFMFSEPYSSFDEYIEDTDDREYEMDQLMSMEMEQYDEEFQVDCMLATLSVNNFKEKQNDYT